MEKKRTPCLLIRDVVVDPFLSPQEVVFPILVEHTDFEVLLKMPDGGRRGNKTRVYFFQLDHDMNDRELIKKYRFLNLVPADPFSVGQINVNDTQFCEKHPNFTRWKNEEEKWCFLAVAVFKKPYSAMVVNYCKKVWPAGWWAAGVRTG